MNTETTSNRMKHADAGKVKAFARLLSEILEEPEEVILAELLAKKGPVPQLTSL